MLYYDCFIIIAYSNMYVSRRYSWNYTMYINKLLVNQNDFLEKLTIGIIFNFTKSKCVKIYKVLNNIYK